MIIVSNGFQKFHLATAAAELARRNLLAAFCTGAYPTTTLVKWLNRFGLEANRKIARLVARGEPIPEELISADACSEALYVLGRVMGQWRPTRAMGAWAERMSFRWYGNRVKKMIFAARKKGAKLYHYRAGFGHESVRLAKSQGLFVLCDHSIAHPALLEVFISHEGKWPVNASEARPQSPLWCDIQADIEQADAVLVNSDFVKETFVRQGWAADRIRVIYLGVDDAFFEAIPARSPGRSSVSDALRVVFAGGFEKRKGAATLTAAIRQLGDLQGEFELHMAGNVSADTAAEWASLRSDTRVHHHGLLSRRELASLLVTADVFVFPSFAEGSARVIFEALACGCYVITTPNSGSIVEDGVHGRLIPAGDSLALADAIREVVARDRGELRRTGLNNARIVRENYRQSAYGEKLVAAYSTLLANADMAPGQRAQ